MYGSPDSGRTGQVGDGDIDGERAVGDGWFVSSWQVEGSLWVCVLSI